MKALGCVRAFGASIDSACLVGACRTCEVVVASGRVRCNGRVFAAGETVPACAAHPLPDNPVVLRPSKGLSRAQWFIAAVLIGLVFMGMWNVPPGLGFSSMGSMNTGTAASANHATVLLRARCDSNWVTMPKQPWACTITIGQRWATPRWITKLVNPATNAPTTGILSLDSRNCVLQPNTEALGVHQCVNCHGEHAGKRVAKVEMNFVSIATRPWK